MQGIAAADYKQALQTFTYFCDLGFPHLTPWEQEHT